MNRLQVTPAFRLIVLLTLALTLIVALVALTSRAAHGDGKKQRLRLPAPGEPVVETGFAGENRDAGKR